MRAVRFSPQIQHDLEEAVGWYASRSPDSAMRFLAEFRNVVARIAEFGGAFRVVHGAFRRMKFDGFPYLVYYREDGQGYFVTLVIDAARDPVLVSRLLGERR